MFTDSACSPLHSWGTKVPLLIGCLWIAILPSVPNASPRNLSVISVNSTTMMLSWDPPPFDQINGYIRHYVVTVTEHETTLEFQEQPTTTQVTLQSLHPYYTYTCRVAAVTTGAGPFTGNLTIQLPEDGKIESNFRWLTMMIFCLRIKPSCFLHSRCLSEY